MKIFIFLCFLSFTTSLVSAQSSTQAISLHGNEIDIFLSKTIFKFPDFRKGHVYMKAGEEAIARLNYNYLLDNFMFINEKKDTMALANVEDVDYVSFPTDSFFYDKKFYEWIASSARASLAVRTTYRFARKDNVGAYGTSSPTLNVESKEALLGYTRYEITGNQELTFEKSTAYFIRKSNGQFIPSTTRNLEKIFSRKDLDDYVAKNKLNLKKQSDLLDLFVYASR